MPSPILIDAPKPFYLLCSPEGMLSTRLLRHDGPCCAEFTVLYRVVDKKNDDSCRWLEAVEYFSRESLSFTGANGQGTMLQLLEQRRCAAANHKLILK